MTDRGLARITYDADPDLELERLARLAGPRVLRAPRALDETRRELDDYFDGRRKAFDLELDLRGQATFAVAVLGELARSRTATRRRTASSRIGRAARARLARSGW